MKRIFEWIGGFALIAFSFYFTDRVSLLVASKSDLMTDIKSVSAEYSEAPTDAIINKFDNTIIPGKFGKEVNDKESYLNMHDFGTFNENYLIYNYIKPDTSLEDNRDKYITRGNELKRSVSFILEENTLVENFFKTNNLKYDIIMTNKPNTNTTPNEIINGANTKEDFMEINSIIKKKPHICINNFSDETLCKRYDYYIIKPELTLENRNITEIRKYIKNGSIILITAQTTLENIKVILNEIRYKDLELVYVSELINERA